jgi:hypothetical protein
MRLGYLGAVVAALLVGCGRTWPAVLPLADPGFVRFGGVRTVAILPIDVTVAAAPSSPEAPEVIYQRFSATATGEIGASLVARGYAVVPSPLTGDALAATLDAFARAAELQRRSSSLVPPDRPAPLQTGDATLYVGGFAFSGVDQDGPSAGEIAGMVIIGIVVVALVVLLALGRKGGGLGHGHGGGHGGGGHGGGGVGHAVGGGHGVAGGHGAVHIAHPTLRPVGSSNVEIGVPTSADIPDDAPSSARLAFTLVDNQTGRTLWHAEQELPANPARDDDVREAIARMMAGMPVAR